MKKLAFALLLAAALGTMPEARAQRISDYTLVIDKRGCDAANMCVDCSFRLDFEEADSVALAFGGDPELSVEHLTFGANPRLEARYDAADKRLLLRRSGAQSVPVRMSYNYTNLSAFFIYGAGNAELWETSYGEFYYPIPTNGRMELTLEVRTPDSLSLLGSYPLRRIDAGRHACTVKGMLAQSLSLAFFRTEAYTHSAEATAGGDIDIYQLAGMECTPERRNELLTLTQAATDYFGRIYGETYRAPQRNIPSLPTFLFHDGKGFSNRYNIGFISASQEKFSTYPDIYPLVHEIGHRWLGEWTLLIDDGEPGAYFIKESLNEFMTRSSATTSGRRPTAHSWSGASGSTAQSRGRPATSRSSRWSATTTIRSSTARGRCCSTASPDTSDTTGSRRPSPASTGNIAAGIRSRMKTSPHGSSGAVPAGERSSTS